MPLVGWQLPWSKKNAFDRSRVGADLKRIEAFYADRGYPDARVSGFNVTLNKKENAVDVTLTIIEGQPVRVASVHYVGFDDVIPPAHLKVLEDNPPLKVGEARDRQLVIAAHEQALNELRDHGYAYANVAIEEQDGETGKDATITFRAEPGVLAHFGPISVAGNQSVSDHVIQRELTFHEGELYRTSVVQNSQRRLYGLDLFQFVNVETINSGQTPDDVPMRVTVAEGKHHRVNFGIGYGTEEKERFDGEFHHLNFLGGARTAGVHGRWSSLDRGVRLDVNQPYFFAPHFSLGAEAQQWHTFTPAYNSTTSGGKLTLTHRADPRTSWSISLTSERDTSAVQPAVRNQPTLRGDLIALGLDPTTDEQRGTLNAAGFDLQRSTADNVINARRGYQLSFHVEEAGTLLPGTFHYYAVSVDGRHYQPITDSLVLANRVQFGNIAERGGSRTGVPFAKRYFLGGATSVRGWGRFEISPLSSGLPIGGDSMLAFSSELRAMLNGKLGAVVFLDGGNVWANQWTLALGDLRYAVGPGLRYQTPVGPIRFDVGYQLNPIPGLIVNGAPQARRWRLHFSIGQAF